VYVCRPMRGQVVIDARWKMHDEVTGEVREGKCYASEDATAEHIEFNWLENNWSCDHNRSAAFYPSGHDSLPDTDHMQCELIPGGRFRLLSLLIDGVEYVT
jgi:hypothetical protein